MCLSVHNLMIRLHVVDHAPKNQNEEFQVQNTLGYTFGGDISISN